MSSIHNTLIPTSSSLAVVKNVSEKPVERPPLLEAPASAGAARTRGAKATAANTAAHGSSVDKAAMADTADTDETEGFATTEAGLAAAAAPPPLPTHPSSKPSVLCTAGSAAPLPSKIAGALGTQSRGPSMPGLQIKQPNYLAVIPYTLVKAWKLVAKSQTLLRFEVDGFEWSEYPARVVMLREKGNNLCLSPGSETCKELLRQGMLHVGFRRLDDQTLVLVMSSDSRRLMFAECMDSSALKPYLQRTEEQPPPIGSTAIPRNPVLDTLLASGSGLTVQAGKKQTSIPQFLSDLDGQNFEAADDIPFPKAESAATGDDNQTPSPPAVAAADRITATQKRASLASLALQAAAEARKEGSAAIAVELGVAGTKALDAALHNLNTPQGVEPALGYVQRTALWHSCPEYPDGIPEQQSKVSQRHGLTAAVPSAKVEAAANLPRVTFSLGLQQSLVHSTLGPLPKVAAPSALDSHAMNPNNSSGTAVAHPSANLKATQKPPAIDGMRAPQLDLPSRPAISSGRSVTGIDFPNELLHAPGLNDDTLAQDENFTHIFLQLSKHLGHTETSDVMQSLDSITTEEISQFFSTNTYDELCRSWVNNDIRSMRAIRRALLKQTK